MAKHGHKKSLKNGEEYDADDGSLWVYYSSKALDEQGGTFSKNKNISCLWYLEKDETGRWRVVNFKEHP